jgi:hypothetical protein
MHLTACRLYLIRVSRAVKDPATELLLVPITDVSTLRRYTAHNTEVFTSHGHTTAWLNGTCDQLGAL